MHRPSSHAAPPRPVWCKTTFRPVPLEHKGSALPRVVSPICSIHDVRPVVVTAAAHQNALNYESMASYSATELARQKRQLRAEIARSRRAIDRHAMALIRQTRATLSWRHWVRAFPIPSVASAFALGLLVSAGLGRRAARNVTRGVLTLAFSAFWRQTLSLAAAAAFTAWTQRRQSRPDEACAPRDESSRTSGPAASEVALSQSPEVARPEVSNDRARPSASSSPASASSRSAPSRGPATPPTSDDHREPGTP